MKPSLAGALIALQLVTAGLVVGLMLRRNDLPDAGIAAMNERLERLAMSLEGALHRQAQIALVMDELRQRWQAAPIPVGSGSFPGYGGDLSAGTGSAGNDTSGPSAVHDAPSGTASPLATPKSPFPEAAKALAALKHGVLAMADERAAQGTNVGPLEIEVAKCRDALLALGHQAIFVVRREVELQPFETERDVRFIEHLLLKVVPPLSLAAKSEAFNIARSALVRQTNEPELKFAGAVALQQIDGGKWCKDVLDVAKLGTSREVTLRCQLLGLFIERPDPSVVELCILLLNEARYPPELRNQAIFVLARQDSSAVNPALRRVLFEEPNQLMKNHAFDALWNRLESAPADRRKLLEDVLASNPAQMPDAVIVKAKRLREELDAAGAAGN